MPPMFWPAACVGQGAGCGLTLIWSSPPTGHSVWAERYDRELQDVFEVQDEIARFPSFELDNSVTVTIFFPEKSGPVKKKRPQRRPFPRENA
jgi:hypothetical protein